MGNSCETSVDDGVEKASSRNAHSAGAIALSFLPTTSSKRRPSSVSIAGFASATTPSSPTSAMPLGAWE